MAKSTKEVKDKAIEVTLWEAANKLRGSVEPAEYKHVVLGLIFLKFASDKFEDHRAKLMAEGKEKYIEMPDFYNMNNVFFLEEISRWSYLIKKSKQNDIQSKKKQGVLFFSLLKELDTDIVEMIKLRSTTSQQTPKV